MLVEGEWVGRFQPVQAKDNEGGFVRQPSQFRRFIGEDAEYPVEPGRYHLYVSMVCPWACRTLAARALLGLEEVVSVSRVEPELSDEGWRFGNGELSDPFSNAGYLHQLYSRVDPSYTGRATVPILWDIKTRTIVNNESADILRMLNSAFRELVPASIDLFPAELAEEQDRLSEHFYDRLNNGVYRAGFATTQVAYDRAVSEVFGALSELERLLAAGPYLLGERLTALDIRIFVTLVRFDTAYHGLFKCNLSRVADSPRLRAYIQRIYALPGVADTVDLDAIKRGYYSIRAINPGGIVPRGPAEPW